MKAKIIRNLSAPAPVDGDHQEPFGTNQHVAHFPHAGVICQVKLGAAGLQYKRPGVVPHVIPLADLVAFFEQLEPKFAEKPNGETRPSQVDELGAALTDSSAPEARRTATPAQALPASPANGV